MHRVEAGHFIIEDHLDYIATHIRRFYSLRVDGVKGGARRDRGSAATAAD
jgi:hypothetical protein